MTEAVVTDCGRNDRVGLSRKGVQKQAVQGAKVTWGLELLPSPFKMSFPGSIFFNPELGSNGILFNKPV